MRQGAGGQDAKVALQIQKSDNSDNNSDNT